MSDESTSTQTHLTWREREKPPETVVVGASSKKIPAALCAIFLGSLGVHKFVLGYVKEGVMMLLVTAIAFGIGGNTLLIGGMVTGLIGVIEGILYLTKSDARFAETYVAGRRGWF